MKFVLIFLLVGAIAYYVDKPPITESSSCATWAANATYKDKYADEHGHGLHWVSERDLFCTIHPDAPSFLGY